jgi:hypothetical protein
MASTYTSSWVEGQGIRNKVRRGVVARATLEAGIPPAKALQIATFKAARLLQQEKTWAPLPLESEPTLYSWKEIQPNTSATFAAAGG